MYQGRTVAWIEENVGVDELTGWLYVYEHEPWGDAFDDANHAATRAILVDVNRSDKDKRRKPIDARKYLIQRGRSAAAKQAAAKQPQTPEAMKRSLAAWAGVFSNKTRKPRRPS